MHNFSIDAFNLVGNLLHHLILLAHSISGATPMDSTQGSLPPGIIG